MFHYTQIYKPNMKNMAKQLPLYHIEDDENTSVFFLCFVKGDFKLPQDEVKYIHFLKFLDNQLDRII